MTKKRNPSKPTTRSTRKVSRSSTALATTSPSRVSQVVSQRDIVTGEMIKVKVNRILPDEISAVYCDAFLIQHTGEAFFLSFLQTRHKLETNEERIGLPMEVNQVCMSRIAVTPLQMAQNLKAMIQNFEKWLGRTDLKAKTFEDFLKEVSMPYDEVKNGSV